LGRDLGMGVNYSCAAWIKTWFQMQLLVFCKGSFINFHYKWFSVYARFVEILLIHFSLPTGHRVWTAVIWHIVWIVRLLILCMQLLDSFYTEFSYNLSKQPTKRYLKTLFFLWQCCVEEPSEQVVIGKEENFFSHVNVSCSCCLVPSVRSSVPLVWCGSYEPLLCTCVWEQKQGGWSRGMSG